MNRVPASGVDPAYRDAIQVPLYELVYHDAVVTTYSPDDPRGLLHASVPEWRSSFGAPINFDKVRLEKIRRMAALHKRVGLLEMTNHKFLDPGYRKERTTFADGTTVRVDWDTKAVTIHPT